MNTKRNNDSRTTGLSAQEREILGAFAVAETPVVTADEIISVHPVPRDVANQILSRLCRKGWLHRVKRGLYVPVPLGASDPEHAIEDAWPLAMSLFAPCFISGWSAAEHWDLTEQIFNSIAVITQRPQRRSTQSFSGISFRTRTVLPERFFGMKRAWFGSRAIDVADPHRLVIDILESPEIGGGGRHTVDVVRAYWASAHADATTVLEYATRYHRGTVFKRLGFLAESFADVTEEWLDSCQKGISAGTSKLDPAGSDSGPIVSRWNLRINVPLDSQ